MGTRMDGAGTFMMWGRKLSEQVCYFIMVNEREGGRVGK